ncbi:uncharacterized protein MELLADRAFT_59322 [Melampsora larici-populina 98AG31]|uniref:Uncharacterized protein n=1 Tax=Melampsora larici-populina (strain 98AG31 / pathotype 3-4-7) TaxID=747676 RepID=F4R5W1_MELLP|nr:uncharacterized protein MELLADRAFT_59322 [Melampsora larici-populina 98AG31]EGG12108.1 hypothetical protein MELLADRAFT_59322 [Melampsora larici-populina 98AG31]
MSLQDTPSSRKSMLTKSHRLLKPGLLENTTSKKSRPLEDSELDTWNNDQQDFSAAAFPKPDCQCMILIKIASMTVTGFICEPYRQGLEYLKQRLNELSNLMPMTTALNSAFNTLTIEISRELSEIEAGTFKDSFGHGVHTQTPWFQPQDSTTSFSTSLCSEPSSSQKRRCDYSRHTPACPTVSLKKRKKVAGETPYYHHQPPQRFMPSRPFSMITRDSQTSMKDFEPTVGPSLRSFGLESKSPTSFILPITSFPISTFPDPLITTEVSTAVSRFKDLSAHTNTDDSSIDLTKNNMATFN